MYAWLIETFGEQNALYVAYAAGAAGFLLLVWVLWFWTRRVSGGVFVHGGRGRKPRLAVVDATAIDSHRRIVLVRRDDVEHLVMIGGHNDFVIERGIGVERTGPDERTSEPAAETSTRTSETPSRTEEPSAGLKRRPDAPRREREPVAVEKAAERKTPPPRPAIAESKPAPAPAPQAVRQQQPKPVSVPEPAQSDLPGAYAEVRDEPPMRPTVQAAPIQTAAVPAAYAEHVEPAAKEKAREPAFDIEPETVIEKPAQPAEQAPGFEDHVRASIAEAEATISATPANDGSLEDEMQKLLNELTRKK